MNINNLHSKLLTPYPGAPPGGALPYGIPPDCPTYAAAEADSGVGIPTYNNRDTVIFQKFQTPNS